MSETTRVCSRCMDQADVPERGRPAAQLENARCDMCRRPYVMVYCCTDQWMHNLLTAEVHNQ